jgi:hypothetical protein
MRIRLSTIGSWAPLVGVLAAETTRCLLGEAAELGVGLVVVTPRPAPVGVGVGLGISWVVGGLVGGIVVPEYSSCRATVAVPPW